MLYLGNNLVPAVLGNHTENRLKGFEGNNFEVGVGPMATRFVVGKPPYQAGDQWRMVVDGQELIKTADSI